MPTLTQETVVVGAQWKLQPSMLEITSLLHRAGILRNSAFKSTPLKQQVLQMKAGRGEMNHLICCLLPDKHIKVNWLNSGMQTQHPHCKQNVTCFLYASNSSVGMTLPPSLTMLP